MAYGLTVIGSAKKGFGKAWASQKPKYSAEETARANRGWDEMERGRKKSKTF